MMLYEKCFRPILFHTDPEWIHTIGIRALQIEGLSRFLAGPHCRESPNLSLDLWGLKFRNRLGLAAGFDKNAEVIPAFYHLGFGFIEVGTVTARAQPGNPLPRIFRLPEHRALINRMGFPNQGAESIAQRLKKIRTQRNFPDYPIGINLGKTKVVELDQAPEDYLASFKTLEPYGDFFVINVSSPNTPNLRQLQAPHRLKQILLPLMEENRLRAGKPVLLKISPDLEIADIDRILETIQDLSLQGIVATNTTLDRSSISGLNRTETGGLSGFPVRKSSTEIIRHIHRTTDGKLPIIGVGGVFTRRDYLEKLDAGASLVQTYTGFIYQGPQIARKILCDSPPSRLKPET